MKTLFTAGLLLLLSVVLSGSGWAYYLDPPHNETNGIGCANCHTDDYLDGSTLIAGAGGDIDKTGFNAVCLNCHGTSWVTGQWKRFENTIRETNADILTATTLMNDIWKKGLADYKANPFDEAIEKKWTDAWQLYANTTRFASAMGGGGDYGVYADGRYHLSRALLDINDWRMVQEKIAAKPK